MVDLVCLIFLILKIDLIRLICSGIIRWISGKWHVSAFGNSGSMEQGWESVGRYYYRWLEGLDKMADEKG